MTISAYLKRPVDIFVAGWGLQDLQGLSAVPHRLVGRGKKALEGKRFNFIKRLKKNTMIFKSLGLTLLWEQHAPRPRFQSRHSSGLSITLHALLWLHYHHGKGHKWSGLTTLLLCATGPQVWERPPQTILWAVGKFPVRAHYSAVTKDSVNVLPRL